MGEDEALAILNQSPDGVLVVDENTRILFASARVLDLLGYQASELIGQPVSILSPNSLKSAAERVRTEIMDSPGIHLKGSDVPWFARRKDGLAVPVETAVNVTLIGGKKRLVYAIRDVTERHHFNDAEESCSLAGELSAAYARLRLFVRHAPAAIAMLNTEMRYISVSDRWLRDFGLGDQDLRGRSHYEVFPDLPEPWRALYKRCLAGESFVNEDDSFERAEGGVEHLRWEIMPWKNAAGAIGGMMIFSEVVTEKVRAEAEVRRYQNELEERVRERTSEVERVSAAKSRFLAAASHDLRQPLQAAMPTGA